MFARGGAAACGLLYGEEEGAVAYVQALQVAKAQGLSLKNDGLVAQ